MWAVNELQYIELDQNQIKSKLYCLSPKINSVIEAMWMRCA